MYQSREIRWFFKESMEHLTSWFVNQGLDFEQVHPRVDYYHIPTLNKELGIKIREGRLELKQRMSKPYSGELSKSFVVEFEEWIKWSFQIKEGDNEQNEILKSNENNHWLKVGKQRKGVKLGMNQNDELQIYSLGHLIERGCQVEYTRISIDEKFWYTFGLEWFGKPWLELNPELLKEILGGTILHPQDAKSYPRFILEQLNL